VIWLLWLVVAILALTLPPDSWILDAIQKLALALTALMVLFALLA